MVLVDIQPHKLIFISRVDSGKFELLAFNIDGVPAAEFIFNAMPWAANSIAVDTVFAKLHMHVRTTVKVDKSFALFTNNEIFLAFNSDAISITVYKIYEPFDFIKFHSLLR